jgi:hypothetical protein
MAKTFNPNRVGGGTVSIVRAADGTYSLKEEGFQAVTSLNMIDLGDVAKTTTTKKTETATEKTDTTTADQTKAAFMLPKGRDRDDQFTAENMLQSAKDVSKSLQGVTTPTTIQDSMIRSDRLSAEQAAPQENIITPGVKSPTENVFGTADDPVANRLPDPNLKEPDVSVTTAKQRTKKARIRNIKDLQGDKSEVTKAAEGRIKTIDEVAKENIARQEEARQAVTADQGFVEQTDAALGVTAPTGIKGPPSQISGTQVEMKPEVKKTFAETATTALKSVGVMISNMPSVQIMNPLAVPRGESAGAVALNKTYFTDRGDGRIAGNPATDLYAGMNRVSAFGNLENAGAKRLAKRRETIAKRAASGNPVSQKFIDDTNKMDKQQDDYKAAKKSAPVTGTTKPGQSGGSGPTGGGKIVCTMMNESYGFGSFRNKIWLRHSKNLAPEYQIGYHRIFLPLVKKAKTNKILKKILEHIAVHRTIDIRQQERNKIHLIGRVYRTILEPICYWAGKK